MLIIECGSCQTRFQLDPSRIPLRGIRVRCSHCKTAFFLPHPDATPASAADDVAEEVVQDAAASPQTTQDLVSEPDPDAYGADPEYPVEDDSEEEEVAEEEEGAGFFAGEEEEEVVEEEDEEVVEVEVEEEEERAVEEEEVEEEEDWEFNRDPDDADPEPDSYSEHESESDWEEAQSLGDEVDPDPVEDEDEIPGLGEDPDWGENRDQAAAGSDEIGDSEVALASDWGATADSGDEDESAAGPEWLAAAGEGLSLDLADDPAASQAGNEFGEASDFSASEPAAEPATESASESASESVLANEASPEVEQPAPAAEPGDPNPFGATDQDLRVDDGGADALDLASDETLESSAAAGRASASALEQPGTDEQDGGRLPASAGPGMSKIAPPRNLDGVFAQLQRAGRAVGWGLTLSLLGLGLVWGLFRVSSPHAALPEGVALGDFHAEGVRGRWLETARAGVLYTVSGRLVNDARVPRRPESNLRIALVGREGSRLDVPAAVAGAPLPPGYLRELPVEQLRAASVDASVQLASAPLEPGAGSDFLAYFVDLPPEAEGFVLELETDELPARGAAAGR